MLALVLFCRGNGFPGPDPSWGISATRPWGGALPCARAPATARAWFVSPEAVGMGVGLLPHWNPEVWAPAGCWRVRGRSCHGRERRSWQGRVFPRLTRSPRARHRPGHQGRGRGTPAMTLPADRGTAVRALLPGRPPWPWQVSTPGPAPVGVGGAGSSALQPRGWGRLAVFSGLNSMT